MGAFFDKIRSDMEYVFNKQLETYFVLEGKKIPCSYTTGQDKSEVDDELLVMDEFEISATCLITDLKKFGFEIPDEKSGQKIEVGTRTMRIDRVTYKEGDPQITLFCNRPEV